MAITHYLGDNLESNLDENNVLTIKIDLTQRLGLSESKKTVRVAATPGWGAVIPYLNEETKRVEPVTVMVNAYTKP